MREETGKRKNERGNSMTRKSSGLTAEWKEGRRPEESFLPSKMRVFPIVWF